MYKKSGKGFTVNAPLIQKSLYSPLSSENGLYGNLSSYLLFDEKSA
jgi:hypothetical protein